MPSKHQIFPDFSLERGFSGPVAGVDEAGRGPLVGPVVAAAVILDPKAIPAGINDSKKLTPAAREALFDAIQASSISFAIAQASAEEIDRINILQASLLAMHRAVAMLEISPAHCLIDGNKLPQKLPCAATPVVKGDSKSLSIAAASILAKVARDRVMQALAEEFPGYGWASNAGYPTAEHLAALECLGVTPHHRRSYGPVRMLLEREVEDA